VLFSKTVISVPSVLVSRKLLDQVGGFDEDLVMCEDFDLWLRLAAVSEIDAVDEPLTLVLRHAEHSGNEIIAFEDCVRVIEKMLQVRPLAYLRPRLRQLRAQLSAQTAMAHAVSGNRAHAARMLLSSAPSYWPYRQWWFIGVRAMVRLMTPQPVRDLMRAYRGGRSVEQAGPP
jgi:hypothetical protein